jgi:hypothetical protein
MPLEDLAPVALANNGQEMIIQRKMLLHPLQVELVH